MAPKDVKAHHVPMLFKKLTQQPQIFKSKLKEGDTCRIVVPRTIVDKASWQPTNSDLVYTINKRFETNPVTFELRYEDEIVPGRFYGHNLTRFQVSEDTAYRVEKVLKTKMVNGKKKYLVRFFGTKDTYWINESDFE
uniref:Chromo domain-containing protein n=1 Tax=Panagrolaimus sp. JU765 TaxID=591449 RepID=A0AC34RIN3_9BILA